MVAPHPPVLRVVQRKRNHLGAAGQDGVDGPPEVADAFAVDDARLVNPPLPAGRQVLGDEFFYVGCFECVQIQNPIDWDFIRVHSR